jgi:carbon-monoxide dehydrogenase large subunit
VSDSTGGTAARGATKGGHPEFALADRPVFVGARVPRVEDDRLLTGRGTFVADIHLPGMAEMAIVRSFVAHARLTGVDVTGARAADGVLAVVTAGELEGVKDYPDFVEYARGVGTPVLCRDRIRFTGQAVAAVVAEDRYRAEDAAELVEVAYEELPAVTSIETALGQDAPKLYDEWPDNRIVDIPSFESDEVRELFANAGRVVKGTYSMHRHAPVPMETRGCVAEHRDGRLTLWTCTQSPHIARTTLAMVLGVPERDIRVVAPDVGGGFGGKTHIYPEEVLVCWLAMRLGRPIRWIEDRAEHMVSAVHAREQVHEFEAVVDADGTIRALRCHIVTDVGSGAVFMPGVCTSLVSASLYTGPYRIPRGSVRVTEVVTNKTPSGAYRGFGIPEVCFALERFVEQVARETGVDPVALRRRMLIRREDLPYTTPTGSLFRSGSFLESFDRILELAGASEGRARADLGEDQGSRIGMAVVPYVEGTAPTYFGTTGHWTAYDSASVRVEPDGSVVVSVGVTTTGQGVTTMVATLAADALGVPRDSVKVQIGDTDACPYGLGGWGSRSTVVGGGAVLRAAAQVREKAVRIAAHLLEADPADLVAEDGSIHVKGSEKASVSMARVATAAWVRTLDLPKDVDPGLEAAATYDPPVDHRVRADGKMNAAATYANAAHGAVVKVDLETGEVRILDYLIAHDCGTVINPLILEGQITGGVAQGIGGAMYEELPYSPEGAPLATSFMDYLVPSATEIPPMTIEHFESPDPEMPLGVKGAGEAGACGPAAVIANAVANALAEYDVDIRNTPISPLVLRRLIKASAAPTLAGEAHG